MVDIHSPIVKEFLIESFENLSNISEELTRFEIDSNDDELLNSIYRKVHTLKGSASFLGLKILQQITHLSENILDKIREGEIKICGEVTDTLLDSFDKCLVILKSIETVGTEGNLDLTELLANLERVDQPTEEVKISSVVKSDVIPSKIDIKFSEKEKTPVKQQRPETKIENPKVDENSIERSDEIKPKKRVVDMSIENETIEVVKMNQENGKGSESRINRLRAKVNEIIQNIEIKETETKKKEVVSNQAAKTAAGNIADSVVRVNVALLDKIMNVVGELVLNRNQILQFANGYDSPELSRLAHQLNAITTDLQTDIMTTRMQPVGSVLSKFERVVRDLSRQQGKNIKLTITGKDTELDKTLLEAIRDPLTHLIRNSVDHGIEVPEKRIGAGKPEQGIISIKAYHEGGQVTIDISDDGNGIDPERILEKAISKNLVSEEKAKRLTKKQILNLIFTPGFSTAEEVTNISGRGVGMDVVKSNIEKIGGSVDVSSRVGEGAVFKLKIPLTLAIVPALVVESSNETYAIPQVSLVELVRIEEGSDNQIETIHDSDFFRLRGNLIPIFRLDKSLGFYDESRAVTHSDINIAILSAEGSVYGLIVDQVLDTEEIVVKPLSKELKEISIYGGATIMGDGSVALIVDALGFYNYMGKISQGQKIADVHRGDERNEEVAYNDEVLLCLLDDGREYGIPLAIVHRLEEFSKDTIEWSGNQSLVRYRDSSMPIVSFEKTLGLCNSSALDSSDTVVPVVVINVRGTYIGFVVNEIRDIAINHSKISTDTADRDGFVGTAYINEKTITILDLFSIVDSLPFKIPALEKTHKGKVLIVEDSELFLRIQRELFTESGYDVVTALNGEEALSKMDTEYLAVITDVDMPIMNGWELIKKIRSNQDYGKIPVVAVSSLAGRRKEDLMNAGFDFCFDKQNNKRAVEVINQLAD